ncbi:MAG: CRISPR-associated helicase Cas3' [Acidobacteria bacterium]|nr:CRISPR-associated helicase Cas3' [Acidobacteriota bacterium]MBU4306371.1 CRISPR-associated helicase Cas3' [Acidobacteriota bacterium]
MMGELDEQTQNTFFKEKFIAHFSEKDEQTQSLSIHLEEVSKLAGMFASKVGLKEQGELIGFLHDIGKASNEFKQYIESAVGIINPDEDGYVDAVSLKGKVDHSTAGAQFVYRTLTQYGNEGVFAAQILALCLASHHSGLIDCISSEGIDAYSKRMSKQEEKSHVIEVFGKISDEVEIFLLNRMKSKDFVQNLLDRFKTLKTSSDSKETLLFKYGLMLRFLFSCLLDADRLSTIDFEKPFFKELRNYGEYEKWPLLIKRIERKMLEFDSEGINEIRQKISQACSDFSEKPKGLYQLTVPTGGGKTFASLRFALHHADKHKMDRIIYVLPYTTIIDQNAEEIRKVLEEKDKNGAYLNRVVLEHHSNLMPEKQTAKQKVLSENWDAPVVLTTNVQVLESLFGAGTRGARRMHQLANTVIIFDEIQTLPIKCVQMFNTAITFLVNNCGSTVVLCTATQPLLDKIVPKSRSLAISSEQQMISDARQLFDDLKRVEVCDETKIGGWTNDEIKELVEQQIEKLNSVLVVVNTKKSAQDIYQQCKQISCVETFHLSTHMCPAHRMTLLNKIKACLKEKKPIICISTQLIEAGVDISFGSVIRFLAGLDSIAQAAGRCNRNNELYPERGEVYIINSKEENLDMLGDIKIGKEKTERILAEFNDNPERFRNDRISPEAMEQYYQYYFYQRAKEMDYPVGCKSAVGRDDNLFNLLSANTLSVSEYQRMNNKTPEIPFKQAFKSAAMSFEVIATVARGVVVPYREEGKALIEKLCSETKIEKQYNLLREAQRYSVNVFPNVLEKLQKLGVIREAQEGSGVLYLDEQYYSDEFGLSEVSVQEMGFLNDE